MSSVPNAPFAAPQDASLAAAAEAGDAVRVAELVARGADPEAVDTQGTPLLQWTMLRLSRPGFVALLDAGADPARPAASGRTAVHLAAMADTGFYLETLLKRGASADTPNPEDGTTPLFAALQASRPNNVDLLLSAGADPNAADAHGQTALYAAATINDNASALKLLRAGADPHATAADGSTFQHRVFDRPDADVNLRTQHERNAIRDWLRDHAVAIELAPTR
jgi:ankyrin repeat protein